MVILTLNFKRRVVLTLEGTDASFTWLCCRQTVEVDQLAAGITDKPVGSIVALLEADGRD